MRIAQVRRFFKFASERHAIYLRRRDGELWPWTDDQILRSYKFTNVFRQLDRVTLALNKRINTKPITGWSTSDRWYLIVLFRAFNWPDTYDRIRAAGAEHRKGAMLKVLRRMDHDNEKIFTGAYIVTNAGSQRPKIEVMADALISISARRSSLFADAIRDRSMEGAVEAMAKMPMHGRFTSYEVACDMRYQSGMLKNATDVMTWANPGPGARRGLSRICTGEIGTKYSVEECNEMMRELLEFSQNGDYWCWGKEWPWEMREVEHTLCEFDKYERVRRGEGRPRGIYRGPRP